MAATQPRGLREYRILGPLEIWSNGTPLIPSGAKQRALFALLAVHANEAVSTDWLIDALWDEAPPETAKTALQGYISGLRRLLEPQRERRAAASVLLTSGPGYVLRVEEGELDRNRFEAMLAQGRDSLAAGRARESANVLASALALWRGPALADFAYAPWATTEAARLEELRLVCVEERIDAELRLGRHAELVAELQALTADWPFRERLRSFLILALYRAGRQAEALEAYQQARRALVDELGIDPSPALRELEAAILRQDETLAAPSPSTNAAPAEPTPGLASLPRPPSTVVGRERELDDVAALLRDSSVRLVTLTGPGGIGKTRLATEVALNVVDAFPGGVWWVGAEAVRDPAAVVPLIAATMGIEGDLAEHLSSRQVLVVLDNMEQLLAVGSDLVRLLEHAPGLNLLVTSRERLHVSGEHEYGVSPLTEDAAIELFLDRATAVRPAFSDDGTVAAICRRVDCLPLGVELSAVRVNVLEPKAILDRLERRLSLLTGGSRDLPERQRTLRAAIEWSHDLLDEDEAILFRRLAIFAGGFTIEAAERVCGAELDTLASLVDKSLLRHAGDRFSMLGTIHEYALEQLEGSGEGPDIARAHVAWCLGLVRSLAAEADGATTPSSLARLALERENLRLALTRVLEIGEGTAAIELTVELAEADFWRGPAPLSEGRAQFERALLGAAAASPELRARALYEAAAIASMQGDAPRVLELAEQALALADGDGDPLSVARFLAMLASLAVERGDEPTAMRLSGEAVGVATGADDRRTLLNALNSRAGVELAFGRYSEARELFEQCLELAHAVARRPHSIATATFNVGLACVLADEAAEAELHLAESLRLSRELHDPDGVAYCFAAQAELCARRGEWLEAARLLAAAQRLLDEVGATLESVERKVYEGTLEAVRVHLGPEELAEACVDGKRLAETELP